MLFRLPFSKKPRACVGVEFHPEGLAVVKYQILNEVPTVDRMEFLRAESAAECAVLFKQWVADNELENADCNAVLSSDRYQILLVEPPEVPEEELKNAIRWRLKDLLNFPVDQAVLDVFYLPEDGTKGNRKMVYVVASERQKIQEVIDTVNGAGLELQVIDVPELAIRNIAGRLVCDDNSERGMAIARIRPGGGSVFLYRQGNMYLARNFTLEYNGGLMDDLPEDILALELQRSLDYYERQMGQAPPTVIYLCGENVTEDKIGEVLKQSLAVSIQYLDPAATAMIEGETDEALQQMCLVALGGVCSTEVRA